MTHRTAYLLAYLSWRNEEEPDAKVIEHYNQGLQYPCSPQTYSDYVTTLTDKRQLKIRTNSTTNGEQFTRSNAPTARYTTSDRFLSRYFALKSPSGESLINLYCIALHCIALHCIVLYCVVQFSSVQFIHTYSHNVNYKNRKDKER